METIMFFINMVIRMIIMEFVVIEKMIIEIIKIIEIEIKKIFFKAKIFLKTKTWQWRDLSSPVWRNAPADKFSSWWTWLIIDAEE